MLVPSKRYAYRLDYIKDGKTVISGIDSPTIRGLVEMGHKYNRRINAVKYIRYEFGIDISLALELYNEFLKGVE